MNYQIPLVFAIICVQGLLAAPTSNALPEKEKEWLATELKNLREKGEMFKMAMNNYITAKPELGDMIDNLLAKGQKIAADFEEFHGKGADKGLGAEEVEAKYREFYDSLKQLESSFLADFKAQVATIPNATALTAAVQKASEEVKTQA